MRKFSATGHSNAVQFITSLNLATQQWFANFHDEKDIFTFRSLFFTNFLSHSLTGSVPRIPLLLSHDEKASTSEITEIDEVLEITWSYFTSESHPDIENYRRKRMKILQDYFNVWTIKNFFQVTHNAKYDRQVL